MRLSGSLLKEMDRVADHLNHLGIPWVIAGGFALSYHGIRHNTQDLDIYLYSKKDAWEVMRQYPKGYKYEPPNTVHSPSSIRIDHVTGDSHPPDINIRLFYEIFGEAIQVNTWRVVTLPALVALKISVEYGREKHQQDIALIDQKRGKQNLHGYTLPQRVFETYYT